MIELIDELLEDAEERMQKSVESMRNELATVRTGRAFLSASELIAFPSSRHRDPDLRDEVVVIPICLLNRIRHVAAVG